MGLSRIKSASITDGTIATADLANGAVSNTKLSAGSVENYLGTQGFALGMRNRIINGDMRIDQRNAGAQVTPNNAYTLDRWQTENVANDKFTLQQNAGSVTPPAGFSNYLGITSTSAYSITSNDYFVIRQLFEGFNTSDFNFGTANAVAITLSFWVRSSLTGTFGGSLKNNDNSRSYPFSYTISAANTWEYKTVTIPGDTTGTWPGAVNTRSMTLSFSIGAGSSNAGTAGAWVGQNYISTTGAVNVVSTNGATFYITGVQLEVGSVATPFERRPYGMELALCQRYAYFPDISGALWPSTMLRPDGVRLILVPFKQTMRAAPTATYTFDADGSGSSLGTPSIKPDYFRVNITASLTGGADPRFTAFSVTAEL